MTETPREDWPYQPPGMLKCWCSRTFLAQLHTTNDDSIARLSICRTQILSDNAADPEKRQWLDGITWDDLQRVKSECGFGHLDAVEVFPRDEDLVNVANMRHLWLFRHPLHFAWRKDPDMRVYLEEA